MRGRTLALDSFTVSISSLSSIRMQSDGDEIKLCSLKIPRYEVEEDRIVIVRVDRNYSE